MKISSKSVYNLAFFSIIFMYFKIIPVNIESQPVFVILLIPIFIFLNKGKKITIKKEEKYLIIYMFIIIIYFFIALLQNREDTVMYLLKFTLGPISYIFLLKNVELLNIKTVKHMTIFLSLVAFINLTHLPILYNFMSLLFYNSFNRYSLAGSGIRGMCICTPEPSYFVYFAMLLLFSFDFLEWKLNIKECIWYRICIYIMCILTKSALVYSFLGIYVLYKYVFLNEKITLKHFIKLIGYILFAIIVMVIISNIFNIDLKNNRFYQVFNSFNSKTNIIEILFFGDESVGFRFIMNAIYMLSIFIKPFGYGFGGMERNWSNVANYFNIEYRNNGIFEHTYSENSILHAQAYFPNVIGAVGVFAIFLILFVYSNNKVGKFKFKSFLLIILTLFLWLLQSNMFNPIFWILIGFCKTSIKEKNAAM